MSIPAITNCYPSITVSPDVIGVVATFLPPSKRLILRVLDKSTQVEVDHTFIDILKELELISKEEDSAKGLEKTVQWLKLCGPLQFLKAGKSNFYVPFFSKALQKVAQKNTVTEAVQELIIHPHLYPFVPVVKEQLLMSLQENHIQEICLERLLRVLPDRQGAEVDYIVLKAVFQVNNKNSSRLNLNSLSLTQIIDPLVKALQETQIEELTIKNASVTDKDYEKIVQAKTWKTLDLTDTTYQTESKIASISSQALKAVAITALLIGVIGILLTPAGLVMTLMTNPTISLTSMLLTVLAGCGISITSMGVLSGTAYVAYRIYSHAQEKFNQLHTQKWLVLPSQAAIS